MKVNEEIRQRFATLSRNHIVKLHSLPGKYPAWVIRKEGYYGILIKYSGETISENFNNVKLWSHILSFDNKDHEVLMLTSTVEHLRNEFASICAEFVYPGNEGTEREELLKEPFSWWDRWKSLLGNSVIDKKPYSILAEMIVYEKLIDRGMTPRWGNFTGSTHDLETSVAAYEVKATTNRYESLITINSQFQLDNKSDRLKIIFCRMEDSKMGTNIEEQKDILIKKGVLKDEIENTLYKLGLEKGSSIRKKRYKILETRIYNVDDTFPKITLENLSSENREAIKQITYTLDLSALPYDLF